MSKEKEFERIFEEAQKAGHEAVRAMEAPAPMIIQQHANIMDDRSPVVKQYVVEGGPCGFAWVTVKPGTSAFAKWLKKTDRGRTDSYYGGVTIWVSEFGQSMQRKEVFAQAMAKKLAELTGLKIRSMSRMD